SVMSLVRLRALEHLEPTCVELPHPCRVATKRVDVAYLQRVELRPDAVRGAEVGDARLGADPCAREHHAGLPLPYQLGQTLDGHAGIVRGGATVAPGRERDRRSGETSAQPDVESGEQAGRHARDDLLARLARPREDREQLLPPCGREAA